MNLGPGEMLARDQLFLYITSIFQRFDVNFPPGESSKIEGVPGFVVAPSTFRIVFTNRTDRPKHHIGK